MRAKEAIELYMGRPEDHVFDVDALTGRYGGLINVTGLRYKGLVASGLKLQNEVSIATGFSFHQWDFIYALVDWCSKYTNTSEQSLQIGKRTITQGAIEGYGAKYFCVPAERGEQRFKVAQIS